jgi:predicted Fe-S protein YdhL (DUF1289 family)
VAPGAVVGLAGWKACETADRNFCATCLRFAQPALWGYAQQRVAVITHLPERRGADEDGGGRMATDTATELLVGERVGFPRSKGICAGLMKGRNASPERVESVASRSAFIGPVALL